MAFVNRCIFSPTSGGTGTWTVSAAVQGYLTPTLAGATNATLYRYTAELRDGGGVVTQWEVGTGTYTSAGTTLARTTVLLSSNANALVNFTTPPQVMLCVLAEDLFAPAANDVTALGTNLLSYSDLFLASGGVINWANGNTLLAHTTNLLTIATSATTTNAVLVAYTPSLTATNSTYFKLGVADGSNTEALIGFNYQTGTPANSSISIAIRGAGGIVCDGNSIIYCGGNTIPQSDDGASLGVTGAKWSDLFLAPGGVINWNSGGITITETSDVLYFQNAVAYAIDAALLPTTDGGLALGTAGLGFAGVHFAAGAPINWNSGNVTLTHSAGALVLAGCTLTTNAAGFILKSGTTITGGGTGNVPTLTAGPVTGNPTKWLPYDDNGTTRYLPSW